MTTKRQVVAGRYRAIRTRAWDHFGPLGSDSAKLLLFFWIGPHSTPFGILRVKDAYILADLEWDATRLQQAWQGLQDADLVWRDGELAVVVPYLQSNPPPNQNVITGWGRNLAELPESSLYGRLYAKVLEWLSEEDLTWLHDKIAQSPANRSETVPELSIQSSGPRAQVPALNTREKGAGGIQGGTGGGPNIANPSPIPLPNPSQKPLSSSSSTACANPPVDPRLLTLFSHQDSAKARELARKSGRSEAEICAAEQEAAKVRIVTQGNA